MSGQKKNSLYLWYQPLIWQTKSLEIVLVFMHILNLVMTTLIVIDYKIYGRSLKK